MLRKKTGYVVLVVLTCLAASLQACDLDKWVVFHTTSVVKEKEPSNFPRPEYIDELGEVSIEFDILPVAADEGLPRTIGLFSLLDKAPERGRELSNGMLLQLNDRKRGKELRIVSVDDIIIRIHAAQRIGYLRDEEIDGYFGQIKAVYGKPLRETSRELVYIDDKTEMRFSLGGPYLFVNLADINPAYYPNLNRTEARK